MPSHLGSDFLAASSAVSTNIYNTAIASYVLPKWIEKEIASLWTTKEIIVNLKCNDDSMLGW